MQGYVAQYIIKHRRRFAKFLAMLAVFALCDVSLAFADETIVFGSSFNDAVSCGGSYVNYCAQKFIPSASLDSGFATVTVRLLSDYSGGLGSDVYVGIFPDSSGTPSLTPIVSGVLVSGSSVVNTQTDFSKGFSGVTLSSGTTYYVMLYRQSYSDSKWFYSIVQNVSGGNFKKRLVSDSSWSSHNYGFYGSLSLASAVPPSDPATTTSTTTSTSTVSTADVSFMLAILLFFMSFAFIAWIYEHNFFPRI